MMGKWTRQWGKAKVLNVLTKSMYNRNATTLILSELKYWNKLCA